MAKKNMVSANPPKQQALSMSSSHSHIIGAATGANPLSPEEEDDDICPVCESECTCQNRVIPSSSSRNDVIAASALSTHTSIASAASASSVTSSLKIKLTLPPNLKFRKHVLTASERPNPVSTGANAHHLALGVLDTTVPKRRGRPPKSAVATREATKAAAHGGLVSGNIELDRGHDITSLHGVSAGRAIGVSTGKGKRANKHSSAKRNVAVVKSGQKSKGKATIERKVSGPMHVKSSLMSLPSTDFNDDALSGRFPTFVSAASTSSHTSSSESEDSESDLSSLDSEIEEETHIMRGENATAQGRRFSSNNGAQKRFDHGVNNWDVPSRKSSVGSEDEDADVDSNDSSAEDEDCEFGADSNNGDDADEDLDADTEGGGLDDVELDNEHTSSRIGVTFGDGEAGWSEDEESSFDADLFFANLDGSSSDSDSSPYLRAHATFDSLSDFELEGYLSADEEDALLLMDIDPSVQVRRGPGEFEFGLELDSLSFGWDGQLLFTNTSSQNLFNIGFELQPADGDVNMQTETQDDSESDSEGSATADEMLLQESDGETTEDELVDSDGLPNSRAMMLFRWPSTVSAVDPLSTVGSAPQVPPNASESVRIALASYTAHHACPAPPPTPADILSGKISLDDLDDIEMDKSVGGSQTTIWKRPGGIPTMGEFVSVTRGVQGSAVIDGKGGCVPSPFPRSQARRRKKSSEAGGDDSGSGVNDPPSESIMSSTQSSDETFTQSQLQTSELSSTDAIDLDDVLDSSFLDSEPIAHEHESQAFGQLAMANGATHGTLIQNLNRWDRIPMATFRRTRETVIASAMEGSASDTGLSVYGSMSSLMSDAMLMQPKPNDKKSRRRSKAKGANALVVPNDLLPTRDGERTPTPSSQHQGFKASKKEARREKAMMKRKMMGKPAQYRHQSQYRSHHHHPNHKTRTSGSMQRMNSFGASSSSGPSFGL